MQSKRAFMELQVIELFNISPFNENNNELIKYEGYDTDKLFNTYTLGKEEWRIELATFRLLNASLYHCCICRDIHIHTYIHYGLVFFIMVHYHLLLASGEKGSSFFKFSSHCTVRKSWFWWSTLPPFEVGRARAITLITEVWFELTTLFERWSALEGPR